MIKDSEVQEDKEEELWYEMIPWIDCSNLTEYSYQELLEAFKMHDTQHVVMISESEWPKTWEHLISIGLEKYAKPYFSGDKALYIKIVIEGS